MIARLESPDADAPAQTPSSVFPNAFPKTTVDRERLLLKLNSAAPIVKTLDPEIVGSEGTPVTLTATAVAGDLNTDLTASLVWTDETGTTLGTGSSIEVPLGIGTHEITASVTDPVSGLIGMGGTVVTVADPNQPVVAFADSFEYGPWNGK